MNTSLTIIQFLIQITIIKMHKKYIEKAKQGDEHAMHHLYALYARALLNTAYRILNNKEDAEDALQESFLKAFLNLHQFQYQSTFGAWIKRIVINRCIDDLKKKKKTIFLLNGHEVDRDIPEDSAVLETDQKGKLDELYKALHQLPDGYRTVFSLYMLEGYDHQEISDILQIGVSGSISQLSRAKKKLKSLTLKKNLVL